MNRTSEQHRTIPLCFRFVLLLVLSACGNLSDYDTQQIESALQDSLISTTESWDVSTTLVEVGLRKIIIEGDHAVTYSEEERKETQIRGNVYVQIFDPVGELESEAWSKRANYVAEERQFELFDSVRVQTVSNKRLRTSYLKWTQESDRITTDQFFIFVTERDSLTGNAFNSNTDLTEYTLTRLSGQTIVD